MSEGITPTGLALRSKFRRLTGQDQTLAFTGRVSDGRVYAEGDPSLVYVRQQASNGEFTREAQVRGPSDIRLVANIPVRLGFDGGQMAIVAVDFDATVTGGGNPVATGGTDPTRDKWINQNRITTALSRAIEITAGSMLVNVRTWPVLYNGSWILVNGTVNLTSLVPAANYHRLILIYVDTSGIVRAVGSTAQKLIEPLDFANLTDLQEAWDAASNPLAPIWMWYLRDTTTSLSNAPWSVGGNDIGDVRQFVGTGSGIAATAEGSLWTAWIGLIK